MKVWSILGVCATVACGVLEAANPINSKKVIKTTVEYQPATIRALIVRESAGCFLEVHGRYNIIDPFTGKPLSSRFSSKSHYIQPVADGIKWGENFPGIYQLKIIPDNSDITISVNGIEYKGEIIVYQVEGKLNIVNEVDVDDYIHSQISSLHKDHIEGMTSESIAALVIAARSDAHYKLGRSKSPYFDVIADQEGYEGHAATTPGSHLAQVVEKSRAMILCDHSGAPISTRGVAKGWDHKKANQLATQGMIASHILNQLYPKACVTMATKPASINAKSGGGVVAGQKAPTNPSKRL
jgi:stage II sporulation protein D